VLWKEVAVVKCECCDASLAKGGGAMAESGSWDPEKTFGEGIIMAIGVVECVDRRNDSCRWGIVTAREGASKALGE
jgi:hypothetical protein